MSIYFDLQNNPIITTSSSLTVPKITGIAYPGDDTAADTAALNDLIDKLKTSTDSLAAAVANTPKPPEQ